MPCVMRIPEKYLAREIERIANAGIRSVMTLASPTILTLPAAMLERGRSGRWMLADLQRDSCRK